MWTFCGSGVKKVWVLAYKPNIGISQIPTGAALLKTNIMLMTVENMRTEKFSFFYGHGSHQKEQTLAAKKHKEWAIVNG